MKKIIHTSKAPAAVGPYSQAVESKGVLFVSGQLGIDPGTGKLVNGGVREQTRRLLENLKTVLLAAGYNLNDVVKCTVYLKDIRDFQEMNEVYASFFEKDPPARAAFQVAALPLEALVEIEAVAIR
jgi:2-iminobutanoate/2-iminopropanoate deaminase